MKKWKVSLISCLALFLVVLTGCQSVVGVDLNKALIENMALTSYEGNADFQVELLVDEDAELTEEEAQMVELLNDFSIVFNNIKVEDPMTMSMEGELHLQGETIAFTLTMKENETAVWVEGAKKPIVIPSTYSDASLTPEMVELQSMFKGEAFTKDMLELTQVLGGFFIKHFPNPATVDVENVTETIQDEKIDLKKVHIELNGEELLKLVKGFLKEVLEDEVGLKETLGDLHEIMVPIITEVMGVVAEESDEATMQGIKPYLENKGLAVEFLYTMIQEQLTPLVENYDTHVQSLLNIEGMKQIFNKNNVLSTDIYVDEEGLIRKQTFELTIMPGLEGSNIKGFQINSTSEMWNHDGDVTAKLLDTSDALILDESVSPEALKNLFEKDSQVYEWINKLDELGELDGLVELDESNQEVELDLVTLDLSGENPIPSYEQQPYIEQGTTMVPVRYVSEQLMAQVEWDPEAQQVKVTDPRTAQEILLTVGSTSAKVNGEDVTVEMPVALHHDHVYVPLRFIAEAFGGEVEWEANTKTVMILR